MAEDYGLDWDALEGSANERYWREKLKDQPVLENPAPRGMWERFMDSVSDTIRHYSPAAMGARAVAPYFSGPKEEYQERKRKITQEEKDWREVRSHRDPADSVGDYAADLAGGLVGGMVSDPTNLIAPGGSVAKQALSAGAIGAGADALTQGGEMLEGVRDEFDPISTVINAAAGPLLVGLTHAPKYVRNKFRSDHQSVNDVILDLEGGGSLANPKTSPKGAMGPQQVMPETARKPGFGIRPWDGKSQADLARVGREYSAALMDRYDGDVAKVLAAYNGGFGRVDAAVKKAGGNWLSLMPKESRRYVANGMKKLRKQPPDVLPESTLVRDEMPDYIDQKFINNSLEPKLTAAEEYKQKLLEQDIYKEATKEPSNDFGSDDLEDATWNNQEAYKLLQQAKEDPLSINVPRLKELQEDVQKFHDVATGEVKAMHSNTLSLVDNILKLTDHDTPFYKDVSPEEAQNWKEYTDKLDEEDDIHFDDDPYDDFVGDDETFDVGEYPASHYDYIGADLPIIQWEKNTGKTLDENTKAAIVKIANDLNVHEFDVAEAYLNKDESVGLDADAITAKVLKLASKFDQEDIVNKNKPDTFYAPYDDTDKNYSSLADYAEATGMPVGKLTKQAINDYAELMGIHPDSVASHYLSSAGSPKIKEGVSSYKDTLAKEQMTEKEYAAYQKLPTNDKNVLKVLKKYMDPETTAKVLKPTQSNNVLARAGRTFLEMLKDNRGGVVSPDDVHAAMIEWNKGTHYLMKDENGEPLRVYHGTNVPYEGMPSGEHGRRPPGYVLYSTDPHFANKFAEREYYNAGDQRVFPAYVKNTKEIADFRKPEDLQKAIQWYKDTGKGHWGTNQDLAKGHWSVWEIPEMMEALGWKGAFVTEGHYDKHGTALNLMLKDELVRSPFDPMTYQNKTIGHKIVNTLRDLIKDDSGSYRLDPDDVDDPVEKQLIEAIQNAKPVSAEQRSLYRQARAEKAGKLDKIQQEAKGEAGYHEQLGAAKGELPKADYESIRDQFTPEAVDHLVNKINASKTLMPLEKLKAQTALMKLLGVDGAKVPTAGDIKLLSQVYSEGLIKTLMDTRPLMERIGRAIGNALNMPRALMSSFDLSAPLRQGIFFIDRPEYWKSFAHMFKVFGSENASKALIADIRSRPSWELMKRARLAITDPHSHFLADREEGFISDWAEKIPLVGLGVKASNRAYSGFLNKLRADTFDSMVRQYEKMGVNVATDTAKLRELANFINAATGRGSLGKRFDAANPAMAATFFSPRLIASRIQMLSPHNYLKADPVIRKQAWRSLIAYTGYVGTLAALGKYGMGWDVESDPTSSDFMKLKNGNTRYDHMGGFQQFVVLTARLLSGDTKQQNGETRDLDDGKFGKDTRRDVLIRFLINKLAPVPSLVSDLWEGKDPTGQKVDITKHNLDLGDDSILKNPVAKRFLPMAAQDLADVLMEDQPDLVTAITNNGLKTAATAVPSLLGVGVSTYKPREKKEKKDDSGIDWDLLGGDTSTPSVPDLDWSQLQ